MNKKQIEARIKFDASQVNVPDLKKQILAQVPNRKVVVEKKRKSHSLTFRFSYVFAALALVLVCLLATVGIKDNGIEDNKDGDDVIETPIEDIKMVTDTQKAYANGVATLSGFIGSIEGGTSSVSSAFYMIDESLTQEDRTADINEYLNSVLQLLDEESRQYVLEELSDGDYQYKLIVTNNVLGDSYETIIYYNEVAIDNKKHDELDEVSTRISGIIIQNETNYEFYGSKEVSDDECEVEIVLKISDTYYVAVSQEIEKHEKEFEYKFFKSNPKNSKPYKTLEVEIEFDGENTSVGLSVNEDDFEYEMDFKYNKKDQNCIDVKYDDEDFRIKVNESDHNKYSYEHKGKDKEEYEHIKDYDKPKGNKDHEHETESKPWESDDEKHFW